MPFSRQTAQSARLVPFGTDGKFPTTELHDLVHQALVESMHSRVAIMADGETPDSLAELNPSKLHPKEDYYWTGIHVRKGIHNADRRVIIGTFEDWFQWYMRNQRFRAFQTLILIEPLAGVSDPEYGGYIDGLLARLMGKIQNVVIFSKGDPDVPSSEDEHRAKEVIRALLYGTRLTRPEVFRQLSRTFVPIEGNTLTKVFTKYTWRISKEHPRYRLDEDDEVLLQGMVSRYPHRSHDLDEDPYEIEQFFRRKQRFKPELRLPDDLIMPRVMHDAAAFTWVTPAFEAGKLEGWLHELNTQQDPRLEKIFRSQEHVSDEEWLRLLSPRRKRVRKVLDMLIAEGKVERTIWYREVGRPAFAYSIPGKTPFLGSRCGQCAFYVPSKKRCRLWHLANHTAPFFHPKWKEPHSKVTMFERHKMRFASRIGPHSSACQRFLRKKRDHLRKAVPEKCETCGSPLSKGQGSVTCQNCKTRYLKRWDGKVRALVAYEHEFSRIYHEATGWDSREDLEAYKRDVKEFIRTAHAGMPVPDDIEAALAEESEDVEHEPRRARLAYSLSLQEKVDGLARTTDIARQLSIAMAQSAVAATKRMLDFSKIRREEAEPLLAQQGRFLRLIEGADHSELLPYEAQVMRQYWLCYGLALKGAPQIWFGPRKRSRFVREYVGSEAGRAKGYSPMDSAINYLHQRRLYQSQRINAEIGFPGSCDGFLHRERYNSRKIGLLLDMIDPFKFADREELLLVVLDQGLTWKDFRIETDRRGSNFYYPTEAAGFKLDQAGLASDDLIVRYRDREMRLSEAYKLFAESMLRVLSGQGTRMPSFNPFVLEFPG